MVINHNMSAMFAQRSQGLTDLNNQKNMEKLSSGMRINRAGDDASGLAVSEKMRAQIRGLNQASENAFLSFRQLKVICRKQLTSFIVSANLQFSHQTVFIQTKTVCRSRLKFHL